ncbi:MAG: purine-nucleoside phosphorylase [Lachnospiraceae bacterium]|nr:purine-nucleoside phosphorylase [Lachnospiraceae bacterium]
MSDPRYEKLERCLKCVREKTDFKPLVALVLGSGLGDYAKGMDIKAVIPYEEIEGFPISTVPGHKGQFVFGYVGETPVVCMQGRVHYYEGYDVSDVVLPTRLMYMMGARFLVLTNASGGINDDFSAGDMMLIKDHISLFAPNPLIGPNIDELGIRFPDMSSVYDVELMVLIRKAAAEMGIVIREGIYAQLTGPSFESPAEIQMLKKLGADAVGMSTVVEAITANHMGMRICAISCVSNMAAGISATPLTHEEVQQAANENAPVFKKLVNCTIEKIGKLS